MTDAGTSYIKNSSVVVPKPNKYSPVVGSAPTYTWRTLVADVPAVVDIAASSQAIFTIPSLCCNLGRTRLKFRMTGGAPGANKFAFMHLAQSPIQAIRLTSESGTVLAESNQLAAWQKVIWPLIMSPAELRTHSQAADGADVLFRSELDRATGAGRTFASNGTAFADHASSFNSIQSHAVLANGGGSNNPVVVDFDCPLSVLAPFCGPLSNDLDLWFGGQNLTLSITFSGARDFTFIADDADLANIAQAPAVAVISSLSVQLCLQSNPAVVEMVMGLVAKDGLSIRVPNLVELTEVAGGTQFSRVHKINSTRGSQAWGILHALTLSNGVGQRLNAGNAARWASARTYVQALPEQVSALSPADFYNAEQDGAFRDTLVTCSRAHGIYGSIVARSWTGMTWNAMWHETNLDAGLDLMAAPLEAQIEYPSKDNANHVYFGFVVTSRRMVITPGSVALLNV